MRRARIQIKPNVSKAAEKEKTERPSVPPADTSSRPAGEQLASNESHARPLPPITHILAVNVNDEKKDVQGTATETTGVANVSFAPLSPRGFNPLSPKRRIAHTPVITVPEATRKRLTSTCDPLSESDLPKKKKFHGDEEFDPKTMRMIDMIYWNPKAEKSMTSKKDKSLSVESSPTKRVPDAPESKRSLAPRVMIGPDGNIVLDESSLVVYENSLDISAWETVEEDNHTRRITSLSFRKRLWRKGTPWTEKETELFYEILRCTGPDFGLMHEFFPSRARNELKSKFNREERINWPKISELMSQPAILDDSLYEKAEQMVSEIEQEVLNKKKRKSPKRSDEEPKKAEIEWDEATADLEKEAIELIERLERESAIAAAKEMQTPKAEKIKKKRTRRAQTVSEKARSILKAAESLAAAAEKLDDSSSSESGSDEDYAGYDESSCSRKTTTTSRAKVGSKTKMERISRKIRNGGLPPSSSSRALTNKPSSSSSSKDRALLALDEVEAAVASKLNAATNIANEYAALSSALSNAAAVVKNRTPEKQAELEAAYHSARSRLSRSATASPTGGEPAAAAATSS